MWHDVKLYPTEGSRAHNVVNMVNEIPRCSRKKYEIATNEGEEQLLCMSFLQNSSNKVSENLIDYIFQLAIPSSRM
jgi:inorganic pyrophosphatase